MVRILVTLILITFTPAFELRASIPYGFYDTSLGPAATVTVCILANVALAPLVWVFLDRGIHVFLRVGWIDRLYQRVVLRARDRLHPYVERWGTLGLALFIGVPLPGSGVYSGALGAYLLGFEFRQYMLASIGGVLIAGAIVTAVVMSGTSAWSFLIKQ
ncbi:MAG: ligand-binding protein SH3 [Deltaproteobacteria bacterium]|nr:MAG: ligand-binding protein SH3 [Deltaproteobacteria bacterium]